MVLYERLNVLALSAELKLSAVVLLRTWPTQVRASKNSSASSCIAPSRVRHQDDPLQRQGNFRAIPDDIPHNLGARNCVSEKAAVYMINVLNWMCAGGCATYLLPV